VYLKKKKPPQEFPIKKKNKTKCAIDS